MTDQIPADKVREILDEWERIKEYADWDDLDTLVKDIRDLLPTPPRPTLADMTSEDRRACQWMQADVAGHGTRYVIANPDDDGNEAELVSAEGEIAWIFPEYVTPRPDLPRMEWPGTEKPAPALPDGWRLADHQKYGRVVVTTQTPNINGYVYVVIPDAGNFMGYDWRLCNPEELTYLDQEAGTPDAVPESTLAVGSMWISNGALAQACEESGRDQIIVLDRDGDAYVWSGGEEWWEGSVPPRFAPYTILHDGKTDDQ